MLYYKSFNIKTVQLAILLTERIGTHCDNIMTYVLLRIGIGIFTRDLLVMAAHFHRGLAGAGQP